MRKLYKFGQYPLIPILNKEVGLLGVDNWGNLAEINNRLEEAVIVKTPLRSDYTVEGLDFNQANLMFTLIDTKYQKKYGSKIYTNKLKFDED